METFGNGSAFAKKKKKEIMTGQNDCQWHSAPANQVSFLLVDPTRMNDGEDDGRVSEWPPAPWSSLQSSEELPRIGFLPPSLIGPSDNNQKTTALGSWRNVFAFCSRRPERMNDATFLLNLATDQPI